MTADVRIWLLPTESCDAATLDAAQRLLDGAEAARAARFHFASDRRDFVLAHALLRLALSDAAPAPPQSWCFTADADGKPRLNPGRAGLHFNLSHTRGMVGCVVGAMPGLGFDVEHLGRGPARDLADTVLSPAERATLRALGPEARAERFLRHWTLKEALLKATGHALRLPLTQFGFALEPIRLDPGGLEPLAGRWHFEQRLLAPGHVAAVALAGGAALVEWRVLAALPV
ncbi:4'-phosphopantetheinyl transferase superfamily protein [Fertoebacter nigrum]|uniref:4'-phosphopantetheinyl transferase superfamily protein n=1 Tax=Fertoeibacter niger TaxID=2656921 RepID=A0A8X8KQ50_9RHOB|nr:4'-phosphopantetheinyl transferase superfamily protein [Fertoeibacter niger]NUB43687.1 4'-phosphopantetheinyl transferase superfamily protein [Fertoeibacter niger]